MCLTYLVLTYWTDEPLRYAKLTASTRLLFPIETGRQGTNSALVKSIDRLAIRWGEGGQSIISEIQIGCLKAGRLCRLEDPPPTPPENKQGINYTVMHCQNNRPECYSHFTSEITFQCMWSVSIISLTGCMFFLILYDHKVTLTRDFVF